MKFSKEAVQTEIDLAADELDKAGHTDLAEKVDYYGNRLMTATAGEVPLIRRALSRILDEARRRMGATAAQPEKSEGAKKAEHATTRTRRASDARREVLRRRLMEIVANRKQAMEKLQALRTARQGRREKRQERLAKGEEK